MTIKDKALIGLERMAEAEGRGNHPQTPAG